MSVPKQPCEHCGQRHRKPTPQQEVFAGLYLKSLNATQSYKQAYKYTGNNITERGHQVLSLATVQCLLRQASKDQRERLQLDADVVLGELLGIATANIAEAFNEDGTMMNPRDMPLHLQKALHGFEIDELGSGGAPLTTRRKARFHGKIQALELLGKRMKLWTDVVQHEGLEPLADALLKADERVERHRNSEDDGS